MAINIIIVYNTYQHTCMLLIMFLFLCMFLQYLLFLKSCFYLMQVAQDSVIQLEQRKQMFENQLRELEWRLEQESKVVQYFNTDNNVTILCD